MNNLTFFVQGSAKEPYRITAEGHGVDLRLFCNCPAGRKGGQFCKHVAHLLQGEVTKMVSQSEAEVLVLRKRAEGSPLIKKSDEVVDRIVRRAPFELMISLNDAINQFRPQFEAWGWIVKANAPATSDDESSIELFQTFKNGSPRKQPSLILEYVPFAEEEGEWNAQWEFVSTGTRRPRSRPWSVRRQTGASVNTWATLPPAAEKFVELAERNKPA